MALLQNVTVLRYANQTQPTVASAGSPCPVIGINNQRILGVSNATTAQIASYPGTVSQIDYLYQRDNQAFTGTMLVKESVSTIVTAS